MAIASKIAGIAISPSMIRMITVFKNADEAREQADETCRQRR